MSSKNDIKCHDFQNKNFFTKTWSERTIGETLLKKAWGGGSSGPILVKNILSRKSCHSMQVFELILNIKCVLFPNNVLMTKIFEYEPFLRYFQLVSKNSDLYFYWKEYIILEFDELYLTISQLIIFVRLFF
jgi:hypothetical protein